MTRSIWTLGCALLVAGCAPVFSDLQSARLVGRGRVELTPSASSLSFADDEGSDHVENHYGLQLATGIAPRVDLRARYERAPGVNVVGFGPKLALVKDTLAFALPVGFAFGEDIDSGETWEAHPTLLATWRAAKGAEFSVSGKILLPLSGDERETLYAVNLGLGLGRDVARWAIRPEVGFLWNPGESGHYTHLSLGFSYALGKGR